MLRQYEVSSSPSRDRQLLLAGWGTGEAKEPAICYEHITHIGGPPCATAEYAAQMGRYGLKNELAPSALIRQLYIFILISMTVLLSSIRTEINSN